MNNLPIEMKKDNIFKKFIKFIKNIFKKEQTIEKGTINEAKYVVPKTKKLNDLYKVNNLDNSKANISNKNNNDKKMHEIISIIENNPSVLEKLDISRLKIIDNYYVEKIDECKKKLANVASN